MEHDNSTSEETTAATDTGTFQPPPRSFQANGPKRLYRSSNGPVGGVAEGLSDYTGVDPIIYRLGIAALAVLTFPVIPLVYLAAWIVIPRAGIPIPPIMAPNTGTIDVDGPGVSSAEMVD